MEVAIPHELTRDEVRSRLKNSGNTIADGIPGGMAEVMTDWPSDDRMDMSIQAMGQIIRGFVEIKDSEVVFNVTLPPALGFIKPMVESTIQDQGRKLVAPKKD